MKKQKAKMWLVYGKHGLFPSCGKFWRVYGTKPWKDGVLWRGQAVSGEFLQEFSEGLKASKTSGPIEVKLVRVTKKRKRVAR